MPKLQSLRLVLHHASFGSSLAVLQDSCSLGKLRLQECHSVKDAALAAVAQLTRWGPLSGWLGGCIAVLCAHVSPVNAVCWCTGHKVCACPEY
jgi:hypothetical protein